MQQIPRGKVSSYGAVAKCIGINPRVVGYALHQNPSALITPCHRVVFKDGSLASGYVFGGEGAQFEMLKSEGVKFTSEGKVARSSFLNKTLVF